MGFMAGFGASFSRSFENAQQRKAVKERDAFQIAWDMAMRTKTKYDTEASEDKKLIEAAKGMVSQMPAGTVPEGAWEHVYQQLKGGKSYENAEKWLSTAKFTMSNITPSMPEDIDAPDQASTIDTQMQDSGMAPQQNNPLQPVVDFFDPAKRQQGMVDQAAGQVRDQMGMTQEEWEAMQGGYQSPELTNSVQVESLGSGVTGVDPNELKAADMSTLTVGDRQIKGWAMGGQYFDESRNPIPASLVDNVTSQAQTDEEFEAIKLIDTTTNGLASKRAATMTVANDIAEMNEIVARNGNAINMGGDLARVLQTVSTNIQGVAQEAAGLLSPDAARMEQSAVADITAAMKSNGSSATDASRFASIYVGLKFKMARAMNGTGPLTAQDVQSGADVIMSTVDPTDFINNANALVLRMVDTYNTEVENISIDSTMKYAMSKLPKGLLDDILSPIELGDVGQDTGTEGSKKAGDKGKDTPVPTPTEDAQAVPTTAIERSQQSMDPTLEAGLNVPQNGVVDEAFAKENGLPQEAIGRTWVLLPNGDMKVK